MFFDSGNVASFHIRARTSSKFLGAIVDLKKNPKVKHVCFASVTCHKVLSAKPTL